MLRAREGFWRRYFRLLHRSITFASIFWARWERGGPSNTLVSVVYARTRRSLVFRTKFGTRYGNDHRSTVTFKGLLKLGTESEQLRLYLSACTLMDNE